MFNILKSESLNIDFFWGGGVKVIVFLCLNINTKLNYKIFLTILSKLSLVIQVISCDLVTSSDSSYCVLP